MGVPALKELERRRRRRGGVPGGTVCSSPVLTLVSAAGSAAGGKNVDLLSSLVEARGDANVNDLPLVGVCANPPLPELRVLPEPVDFRRADGTAVDVCGVATGVCEAATPATARALCAGEGDRWPRTSVALSVAVVPGEWRRRPTGATRFAEIGCVGRAGRIRSLALRRAGEPPALESFIRNLSDWVRLNCRCGLGRLIVLLVGRRDKSGEKRSFRGGCVAAIACQQCLRYVAQLCHVHDVHPPQSAMAELTARDRAPCTDAWHVSALVAFHVCNVA